MITIEHYNGAGQSGNNDVQMLKKALEAGYQAGTGASSDVLKVQSLEKTLKNVQFSEKDLSMWATVPKLPAFSTAEEYNRLESYGADTGGFFTEGDRPEGADSSYSRQVQLVKYIGVTKSVTHQAQLVSTNVGDLQMHAAMTGTRWVLRKTDRALPFADSNIVPEEFNGFFAQQKAAFGSLALWLASTSVRNLRGVRLKEDDLEDGSETIVSNFGSGNLFIAAPPVLSGFTKQYRSSKFIQPNSEAVSNAVMGQRVKSFESQYTTVELKYDVFMRQNPRKTTDAATHGKAPAAPVLGTTPSAAATDTSSEFLTDYDGNYYYAVAAVNKYGESPLTAISASVIAVTSTQAIDLSFSAGAGAYAATGFILYRSELDPTGAITANNLYPVMSISVAELAAGFDGGAAGILRDRNRFIANTFTGMLIENDVETWSYKQLLPIMKMEIARMGTADNFMVLQYGTPQLYAPRKMVFYRNIGAKAS